MFAQLMTGRSCIKHGFSKTLPSGPGHVSAAFMKYYHAIMMEDSKNGATMGPLDILQVCISKYLDSVASDENLAITRTFFVIAGIDMFVVEKVEGLLNCHFYAVCLLRLEEMQRERVKNKRKLKGFEAEREAREKEAATILMRVTMDSAYRDVLKFFFKRISCTCLNAEWARVKAHGRHGHCFYCHAAKDPKELKACAGCGIPPAVYCSRECQKKHWRKHKPSCHK